MNSKNFVKLSICIIAFILFVCISLTVIIDPLFHYHKPLKGMEYNLFSEHYQNDGITKHFDYDAIVTGSSMQENIKCSKVDELFNVNSIKVCFSGAELEKITANLERGFDSHSNIKLVIQGMEDGYIYDNYLKDRTPWPQYLYDRNPFNDVSYLFNKDIMMRHVINGALIYTLSGKKTTDFDDYTSWSKDAVFDRESVIEDYKKHVEKNFGNNVTHLNLTEDEYAKLTEDEYAKLKKSVNDNFVKVATENPDTEFYYYINPCSILFFDNAILGGNLEKMFEEWKYVAKELTSCSNIKLFCFYDDYDMICDLNNYKDYIHHSEDINDYILDCMYAGENQITADNYNDYFDEIKEFYFNYDYRQLLG